MSNRRRPGIVVESLEGRCLFAAAAEAVPRPDHVIVVVEENRNVEELLGAADAPYINSLAAQGAAFTDYYSLGRPSQVDYIGLFSGSFQGVFDDSPPSHPFDAPSLGGELIKAGLDFEAYSEDLPFAGYDGEHWDGYARRHAPWTDFTDVPPQDHRPLTDLPSDFHDLPDLGFIIPNVKHDMHDDTVAVGDAWLKEHLDPYVRWAQTHDSLFILTWDESNYLPLNNPNRVLTLMVGPMVKPGTYGQRLDHYNLLRTIEDMFGLPSLGASATAQPITGAWDERPRVVGREVFYNNSAFDGNSRFANALDDAAIAPDKHALLPGERATPDNYTGYSRGINGVMVDVHNLPTDLTAEDFALAVSGGRDGEPWAEAPRPSAVLTRRDAGKAGSGRVTLTWPDGAIRNQWLRVTVKATARTGLARDDVFYFGNIVGEGVARIPRLAGAAAEAAAVRQSLAAVTAHDFGATRWAAYGGGACGIDSRFDHNRDGRLNALDLLIVRLNLFGTLRLLFASAPET